MVTGLFIGRFQPFHKGHLAVIKRALQRVDELFILIGSTQISRTTENPFTAAEREKMITAALKEEGVTKYKIFKLPDIPDDDVYPAYVASHLPPFDIIFVGDNTLVKNLFLKAGYKVREYGRLNACTATEIRKRIQEGEKYEHMVPPKVAEMMKKRNWTLFCRTK